MVEVVEDGGGQWTKHLHQTSTNLPTSPNLRQVARVNDTPEATSGLTCRELLAPSTRRRGDAAAQRDRPRRDRPDDQADPARASHRGRP